jgi:hypothetical protein
LNITLHQNNFAVREAFSNAYPDKEVLNKVTKFWDTGSVCDWHRTGETLRNVEETLPLYSNGSLVNSFLGVTFDHQDL